MKWLFENWEVISLVISNVIALFVDPKKVVRRLNK